MEPTFSEKASRVFKLSKDGIRYLFVPDWGLDDPDDEEEEALTDAVIGAHPHVLGEALDGDGWILWRNPESSWADFVWEMNYIAERAP